MATPTLVKSYLNILSAPQFFTSLSALPGTGWHLRLALSPNDRKAGMTRTSVDRDGVSGKWDDGHSTNQSDRMAYPRSEASWMMMRALDES